MYKSKPLRSLRHHRQKAPPTRRRHCCQVLRFAAWGGATKARLCCAYKHFRLGPHGWEDATTNLAGG